MSCSNFSPAVLRRFALVSRSFLSQLGLPFAEALPEERIEQAFADEEIDFASPRSDADEVVYTPAVTLWAFLSQMLHAAIAAERFLRELSFTVALQTIAAAWMVAIITEEHQELLVQLRLEHMASHRIGNRPNRIEPRAIKRRPKPHDLLTDLRHQARAKLLAEHAT